MGKMWVNRNWVEVRSNKRSLFLFMMSIADSIARENSNLVWGLFEWIRCFGFDERNGCQQNLAFLIAVMATACIGRGAVDTLMMSRLKLSPKWDQKLKLFWHGYPNKSSWPFHVRPVRGRGMAMVFHYKK